jgi:hypothetical protein
VFVSVGETELGFTYPKLPVSIKTKKLLCFPPERNPFGVTNPDEFLYKQQSTLDADEQYVKKKGSSCLIAPADSIIPEMPPGCWMMDTGCGHDLVNAKMAKGYDTKATDGTGTSAVITFFSLLLIL